MRTSLEALVAIVLFAAIPVVVKSTSANPYTIGIFRLGVATAALAAWMALRGELRAIRQRDTARLAAIGLIFFGHWILLFFAIKVSSASVAAIGLSTYGVHLLVLGALSGAERSRWTDVVAVLLAAAGAVLVVPSFRFEDDVAAGMLLSSASAFLYAMLPLLHRRWAAIPTHTRTLGQFGFALVFFLLFAGKSEWRLAPADWGALLFLAFGVTLIGHTMWVRVTTRMRASVTSIVYYTNIPVAIALGVILLGEPLTARTMSGAVLIIAGSVIGLGARAVRG